MTELNLESLRDALEAAGIPADAYCLSGGLPNEQMCIEQRDDRWRVYYSERGLRSGLREFDSEAEACAYLLAEVRRWF